MTITIEDLLLSLPLVSSEEMLAGMSFIKRVIVILDSNILSLLVTPIGEDWPEDQKLFTEVYQCTEWFYRLLARGAFLTSSESM